MGTTWKTTTEESDIFEGRDYKAGEFKWTGTRVDLIFGSNSELRAIAKSMQVMTPKRNLFRTLLQQGTR